MKLILTWLISSLAVIVSAYIVPGAQISGFLAALLAAIMLGAVNSFIRPILLFLTLPINVLTLGLFTLVINALMVLLAAAIVPGFAISGFWVALLFSVILSLITWLMEQVIKKDIK
ncbi:MAG: phage holin family protein [Patescibacteria group bacterium]|nr:phage holin family protein [Patescibacteria group bacterium]MDD3778333.1 phage holin family protein [Patescibacteria group bacterium]MDD3939786.1 phage holin family protein [Patescibacteria group bacterium]NCU39890.1 phage holin family protein [Candidatus Falkowbacteria bacterium]